MRVTPVLLPGNMCDARMWGGRPRLDALFADHGLDAAVDADLRHDATITAMAARTLAAVEGPLLPVGFSMGGIVALEMARQAPDRLAGLVLIGVNAAADLPERSALRPAQQTEVAAGGLARVLVEELKPNYLAQANRTDTAMLTLLKEMGLSLGSGTFVRQSEALRHRADLRPVLPSLAVPVLYLCGEEDALCPPAWHRQWADATPHESLHVVRGAGHMLPLEAPDALAATIEPWLKRSISLG